MRRILAGAAALVATGASAAVVLTMADRGAATDGNGRAQPPGTAVVTRETLTDTVTFDGELGFGSTTTVTARTPGTVTYAPDGDSLVTRGKPLVKVDNRPVIVMYGTMPAYRALRAGDDGPDVAQLERNLKALGYQGFTVDDTYTGATAAAVRAWQEDVGLARTGVVELGSVVFTPGTVRVDSVQAALGDVVGSGQAVLSYTGTGRAVSVDLRPADQRLAAKDATVGVTLPDGASVPGRVTDVSTVITPGAQGQNPTTTVEVTVQLPDAEAAAAYGFASVDVTFTADKRENVLTVPIAALLALREGGFGVEIVDGDESRYVPVQTGLFSGGRVEVTGDGIAEGMIVGMPK
ncbi:peptidoglycan-binding protein [Micromonospora craterilacus]|uniref:Peptidoglycan-binding protein n=1 Tax=Micromonospora craterilacus TaxID=1655439 RepID=A0A2W2E311_9ACTN|nr:efflux RND transporter periplasmic adaptor subunit [Micromonospora craterilacus]PZG16661.1 peptidoglycan-binding protein [Micromonospora craterilacus]